MSSGADLYRFGPFELDAAVPYLMRDGELVALPIRHVLVLLRLVSDAPRLVVKNALVKAGWKQTFVNDESLTQVIKRLRDVLGRQPGDQPYIETLIGHGYRFVVPVERVTRRQPDVDLDTLLVPYLALVDGRAPLELLDLDMVARACEELPQALRQAPDNATLHIALANAYALRFESTRADRAPDLGTLQKALRHSREGRRLDAQSGEAWGPLAFVLHRCGMRRDAIAAAEKAIDLTPLEWRHYFRLGFVTWGAQRLNATCRVSRMWPGLALNHLCAGMVFVARSRFEPALDELRAGCVAQNTQHEQMGPFNGVGLHWLHALVLGAQGADDDALEGLARELAFENPRHVYSRECCGNTWCACGAIHLRNGRPDAAKAAFHEAQKRLPGHALSGVGLAVLAGASCAPAADQAANSVEAAMVRSAFLAQTGDHHGAARMYTDALAHAEPGSADWLLPADPLINATAHLDAWQHALTLLRNRAA